MPCQSGPEDPLLIISLVLLGCTARIVVSLLVLRLSWQIILADHTSPLPVSTPHHRLAFFWGVVYPSAMAPGKVLWRTRSLRVRTC